MADKQQTSQHKQHSKASETPAKLATLPNPCYNYPMIQINGCTITKTGELWRVQRQGHPDALFADQLEAIGYAEQVGFDFLEGVFFGGLGK